MEVKWLRSYWKFWFYCSDKIIKIVRIGNMKVEWVKFFLFLFCDFCLVGLFLFVMVGFVFVVIGDGVDVVDVCLILFIVFVCFGVEFCEEVRESKIVVMVFCVDVGKGVVDDVIGIFWEEVIVFLCMFKVDGLVFVVIFIVGILFVVE